MSNLRRKVLQTFKSLHITRKRVFEGDSRTLDAARNKINEEYKKNKQVNDVKSIEELVKYAEEVERELRTNVIQAKEVKPGVYRAEITKDTVRLDNVPYKDCAGTK